MPKRIRLTNRLLDAMNAALAEFLAGDWPQGYDDDEGLQVLKSAEDAQVWVWQEIARRKENQRKP
jgi:hypothetical protein